MTQTEEKLNALGITHALHAAQANTAFIRKNFSLLERTVRELNGESCISGEAPRQNSRLSVVAVLERITDKDAMHRLLFSMQSGPRELRGSVSIAGEVTTFVRTSPLQ